MKRITVLLSVACLASVTASAANEFARHRPDERLRALIAEKAPRLRDYEKAAYVAALEQGGESVDWALRNLAASEDPSSRADPPRSIDRCVGVVVVSC